jgi:hypothetical protein
VFGGNRWYIVARTKAQGQWWCARQDWLLIVLRQVERLLEEQQGWSEIVEIVIQSALRAHNLLELGEGNEQTNDGLSPNSWSLYT